MKEIIEDYKSEGFTPREWAVYGLLTLAVVLISIIAGAIE